MQKIIQYVTEDDTFSFGKTTVINDSLKRETLFISGGSDENEIFIKLTLNEFNKLLHDMTEFQKEIS
ncbi:MAG: hypothetical protein ABFD00_02270 [Chloroherpetonaceae bacterium]